MGKDKLFANSGGDSDFEFNKNVVSVFDDMVVRSVPYYLEMQRMMAELSKDFAVKGTNLYDLGCSTGTTMKFLDKVLDNDINFFGVDESKEMLKTCSENLKDSGMSRNYTLLEKDLNKGIEIENASVVIFCLTLQFVRPLHRQKLLSDIYNGMQKNGALIIIEKVLGEDSLFNRKFIKYYYDYKKRNDYDESEIANKREALENVLVPYRLGENKEMLKMCGFKYIDVFFKWYNFSGIIAVK